jgi:hypothetical protein
MDFKEFVYTVLMEKLDERHKFVAMNRTLDVFGIGKNEMTFKEIGSSLGVTTERTRQIMLKSKRRINHKLSIFNERIKEPQVVIKYVEKEPKKNGNLPIVYKPVNALGEMSVRTANCLLNEEIKTVEQLVRKKPNDLLKVPNFGRKSLRELEILLENNNLKFGMFDETQIEKQICEAIDLAEASNA